MSTDGMRKRWAAGVAVMMLLLVIGGVLPGAWGQATSGGEASAAGMMVGTYKPRDVFSKYHLRDAFVLQMQKLEARMRAAQKANDRTKMLAIRQEVQAAQEKLIKQFQADLDRVIPAVAKKAGVDVVVVEVAYKKGNVRTKDLTAAVTEAMNAGARTQPNEEPGTQPSGEG